MRNGRAPTATAPADGCSRAGPKSGSRPRWPISARRPSYWPRRTSASFSRSGRSGRPGVQVDGQLEPLRDPLPERPGQVDAGVDRGVAERDERDDIDRPDARVLALVDVHVDVVDGGLDEPLEGVRDRPVLAGHREHGAVVAGVARPVEQGHAADRADRLGHPVDDIEAAAFGDVGNRIRRARPDASDPARPADGRPCTTGRFRAVTHLHARARRRASCATPTSSGCGRPRRSASSARRSACWRSRWSP